MGAWVSAVAEYPILKVWTFFLKKRGINCYEQPLLALLTWWKSHELDISEGTLLHLLTWERVGKNILAAASDGDETAISAIKPWKIMLDFLKQLNNERGRRMGETGTNGC